MGKETGISWTNRTFNPWWGCTKVSPGCDNCYAETFDKRVGGHHWGKGVPRREFGEKHWNEPLQWNKIAEREHTRHLVFCASMADVMDDEAPVGAREKLWDLIDRTPYLIWQLLTKRPHRYNRYLPISFQNDNVWLGISAENQHFYSIRWPILRLVTADYDCPSWVSYEPALGYLSMDEFVLEDDGEDCSVQDYPDWIIFGGETGNGRRPMEQVWAEALIEECKGSGTKFFMKQFGARTPDEGHKLVPPELLIREFPRS
jgi:protein gp37